MKRYLVSVTLCFGFMASAIAVAGDDIYVTYEGGVPRFSTQPYDESYSLYLHRPEPGLSKQTSKTTRTRSSVTERRIAMASQIQDVARRYGMDPALLSAVAEIESGFNTKAISPKGAIGTMQLIPATAADYGVTDPYNPQQNLEGGARYLKDLMTVHNGNLPLALAAYNAGRSNVMRYHQRIPPFNETMLYVPRVLAKIADYRRDGETRLE